MSSLLLVRDGNGRSIFEMSSEGRDAPTLDYTPDLAVGETIVSATCELVRLRDGREFPDVLDGVPIVQGNTVSQWLLNPPIGESRLEVRAVTSTGRALEPELLVSVPY